MRREPTNIRNDSKSVFHFPSNESIDLHRRLLVMFLMNASNVIKYVYHSFYLLFLLFYF